MPELRTAQSVWLNWFGNVETVASVPQCNSLFVSHFQIHFAALQGFCLPFDKGKYCSPNETTKTNLAKEKVNQGELTKSAQMKKKKLQTANNEMSGHLLEEVSRQ